LLRSILTMPRRDQCPTSRSKCTWPMAIPYPYRLFLLGLIWMNGRM
jgi:hypothetical protein